MTVVLGVSLAWPIPSHGAGLLAGQLRRSAGWLQGLASRSPTLVGWSLQRQVNRQRGHVNDLEESHTRADLWLKRHKNPESNLGRTVRQAEQAAHDSGRRSHHAYLLAFRFRNREMRLGHEGRRDKVGTAYDRLAEESRLLAEVQASQSITGGRVTRRHVESHRIGLAQKLSQANQDLRDLLRRLDGHRASAPAAAR
jgi:hypothetical protein